MDHHLLLNVLYYLAAAVIAVPLFRMCGLGAILGYLAAGAVIGPQIFGLIEEPEHALHFAEFGVVMLLFVIGLELDPDKLWKMRSHIGLLGLAQLLVSAGAIALFVIFFGYSAQIAILVGLTLGLSSTAFAIQLMDEQNIMGGELGRKGFGILLLQDMAVIPILLLVSLWAPGSGDSASQVSWWFGPIAIVAVLLFGRFALNPALKLIAINGSREVLTAAALLIVLGTAMLMQFVNLSMGMGAFLAGIILANSSFRHQLEADIEPFKGLLLGLFFIAVGMTLDLQLLLERPLLIFSLAIGLMVLKTSVIALLVRWRGSSMKDGILLGLMLSQGGEFAFVVMTKAVGLQLISPALSDLTILVVGVSMAFTSPLVMSFRHFSKTSKADKRDYDDKSDGEPEVVIAGFGRFGQIVGRILAANQIHFTALDKDPKHVDFLKGFGNKIFYGDATRLDLLEAAGIEHARILVVTVDHMEDCVEIIKIAQEVCPGIKIVARVHNRMHAYQLLSMEVEHVIRETIESSLLAAKDTLINLGFTEGQALSKVDTFRKHDDALISRAVKHKDDMGTLMNIAKEGRKELEQLFHQDAKR